MVAIFFLSSFVCATVKMISRHYIIISMSTLNREWWKCSKLLVELSSSSEETMGIFFLKLETVLWMKWNSQKMQRNMNGRKKKDGKAQLNNSTSNYANAAFFIQISRCWFLWFTNSKSCTIPKSLYTFFNLPAMVNMHFTYTVCSMKCSSIQMNCGSINVAHIDGYRIRNYWSLKANNGCVQCWAIATHSEAGRQNQSHPNGFRRIVSFHSVKF